MSFIRRRLTWANVAMTLALVFAMSGGAYAAKKYLITSTKQISPKVLKQLQGKTGPAGAQGPAGPQGPAGVNGKDGAQGLQGVEGKEGKPGEPGKEGKAGVNGKSVIAATEAQGANCKEGGSNFEVEGSKTKVYACNGAEGKEGPAGPVTGELPSGVSLTGVWSTNGTSPHVELIPFDYELHLSSAPTLNYINEAGTALKGSTANCPGTAAEPKATKGNLCIYVGSEDEEVSKPNPLVEISSAPKYGALLYISIPEAGYARGSWAVTAP
jgi:hypothetical protein